MAPVAKFFIWKKILVRTVHVFLMLFVTLTLFLKRTDLRTALVDRNYLYLFFYVGAAYSSLLFYFLTCFKNPGFLENLNTYNGNDKEKNLEILRVCDFCNVIQPLRSRHCEDCQRCVKRFDHHCPWLDTCIGEKNHRYFWCFLLSTSILIAWSLAITFKALIYRSTWSEWVYVNWLYLFDLHVLCMAFLVCFFLLLIHTYLMATNKTTWEKASRKRITYLQVFGDDESYNPFHEGYCRNILMFLCYFKEVKWEVTYKKFLNKFSSKENEEQLSMEEL